MKIEKTLVFLSTIVNLFVYSLFCLYLVESKIFLEKYFISPYELIFFLGLFSLIIIIIFEPISYFIPCSNEHICRDGHFGNIYTGFKDNVVDFVAFLRFIYIFFSLFLTSLGLWLTVKYLSPSHFITTDSILTFSLNILFDIYQNSFALVYEPLFYLASLFTIFGCLIYNEIIVITLFNLSYNTRIEIRKRERNELTLISDEISEGSSDTDSLKS